MARSLLIFEAFDNTSENSERIGSEICRDWSELLATLSRALSESFRCFCGALLPEFSKGAKPLLYHVAESTGGKSPAFGVGVLSPLKNLPMAR